MRELPDRFDVDDLRVDLGLQRVKRGDTAIPLPKLSLDLLLALARSAPNLVSVDELMTRVWRGLVVNPETVAQRVKLLRDALGDEPRAPKYIESLRGRGYRLIPDLVPIDAIPPVPVPPDFRRRWLVAAAGGVVAISLVIGLAKGRQGHVFGTEAQETTSNGVPLRSVAVMPFQDLSMNHDGGQLATALPEMVLQRLGMVNGLVVIARRSSFSFMGQPMEAPEIGQRLGARYLVEGSLQRLDDHLRVAVRLVDTQSGRQVQAWRFDRVTAEIFDLQDDIAAQLAAGLKVQLLGVDLKRVDRSHGTSLEAYLRYLNSQALLNRWTIADTDRAIDELEHAIELDPAFALGYAELARAHSMACFLGSPTNGVSSNVAMTLVNRALAIDSGLGEAYVIRAQLEDVVGAPTATVEADYRKGLELAPNYGPGYEMYGETLANVAGRQQESLALTDHAILIDPIDPRNIYRLGLYEQKELHDTQAAEKTLMHALEVGPDFPPAYVRLAQIRAESGKLAEAVQFLEQALRLDPQQEWIKDSACALYLDLGDRRAAGSVSAGASADSERAIMLAAYDRHFGAVASNRGDASFTSNEAAYAYSVSLMHRAVDEGTTAATIATLREELGFKGEGVGFVLPAAAGLGDPITLAYLFKVQHEMAPLSNLVAAIEQVVPKWSMYSDPFQAALASLKGDPDRALEKLSADIRAGHFNHRWVFERDPVQVEIKENPRYLALVEQDEPRLTEQRRLLDQMRRDGQVPQR